MSAIDYRKLRSLTARQLISALERDGHTAQHDRATSPLDGSGLEAPQADQELI